MKVELCRFSGYKIYLGNGRGYARTDGKVFQFLNAKCEFAFLSKRNGWPINWTVLYRRKHRKGQLEEIQKKRTRRAIKFQGTITGKAQEQQAIRAAEEAQKAKPASKKTAVAAAKTPTEAAPKQKMAKPVKVSAPRADGKR